jgi:ornithine cyclodeaminase
VTPSAPLIVLDAAAVRAELDYPGCMEACRYAMTAVSEGRTRQLLRTMIGLGEGRTFGIMPGALGDDDMFGAKLVSVFADPARPGRRAHRGLVILFEPDVGAPVCIADAEEVTLIRTAAMSAVATDALARPDASVLTLYGCGGQAETHLRAIALVRDLREVRVWGRTPANAQAFAARMVIETGLNVIAVADGREAAAGADILCTLTSSSEPVLLGDWVSSGAHVNIVGSSGPGPVEIDQALVVASRFVADSRASIVAQGSEFLDAKAAGAIGDDHIVAEIGEVLLGTRPGRQTPDDITVFKSIGHAMQDLAATAYLYRRRIA